MAYQARVQLDSVNASGDRLTTLVVTMPRFLLAEFNTHRAFSRNSASSRAVPLARTIKQVMEDPAVPVFWGKNQAGMQAHEELTESERQNALDVWLRARDAAVEYARRLSTLNVHKQLANRILEPWMWTTVLVSSTHWNNFMTLRQDRGIKMLPNSTPRELVTPPFPAQPELQVAGVMMREAMNRSEPLFIETGQWHLPFADIGYSNEEGVRVSSGRCARVSYLTHDGKRDPDEDIRLHDDLVANRHWSPLEHPAQAAAYLGRVGNFTGWVQYRKKFPNESGEESMDFAESEDLDRDIESRR